jgi:hypothetical protein
VQQFDAVVRDGICGERGGWKVLERSGANGGRDE